MSNQTPQDIAAQVYDQITDPDNSDAMNIDYIAAVVQAERERQAATVVRYRKALTAFVRDEETEDWYGELYRRWEEGDICCWDSEEYGEWRELSFDQTKEKIMTTDDLLSLVTGDPSFAETTLHIITRYKTARLLLDEEAANVSP